LALYEDVQGRRFLDLEGLEEPEVPHEGAATPRPRTRTTFQITLADLIGAGLLQPGDELVWERPRAGQRLSCFVTDDGRLRLADGQVHSSLSAAASAAAGGGAYDGWQCWRAARQGNKLLVELRQDYLAAEEGSMVPASASASV